MPISIDNYSGLHESCLFRLPDGSLDTEKVGQLVPRPFFSWYYCGFPLCRHSLYGADFFSLEVDHDPKDCSSDPDKWPVIVYVEASNGQGTRCELARTKGVWNGIAEMKHLIASRHRIPLPGLHTYRNSG